MGKGEVSPSLHEKDERNNLSPFLLRYPFERESPQRPDSNGLFPQNAEKATLRSPIF